MLLTYVFILTNLLLLFLSSNVQCQVCSTREVTKRYVTETYMWTTKVSYIKPGCWFNCKQYKVDYRRGVRTVGKTVAKIVNECCKGYMQDDTSTKYGSINCNPICVPACKNGFCSHPGVCLCNKDYDHDPINIHNCLPICSKSCDHGKCVEPDTCECNYGYALRNGTCQPICTEKCLNGICTAPDTCECLLGYRKTEDNICAPYCSKGCNHGKCVLPELCQCDEGYVKDIDDSCVPTCNIPCGNGTCSAPNICHCLPGHILDVQKMLRNEPMCVPSCLSCNGSCVAPNKCVCDPPYEAKHSTASGEECDCFTNCSLTSKQCERTECLLPVEKSLDGDDLDSYTTSTSTFPPNSIWEYTQTSTTEESDEIYDSTGTMYFDEVTDSSTTDTYALNNERTFKKENEKGLQSYWIYVIICVILLVSTIAIIIIIKRKCLANYVGGRKYDVEDDKLNKDASVRTQSIDMRYSTIVNKREN